MEGRKLDVTQTSPHRLVREKRERFDNHLNDCASCQPAMCWEGQVLWRDLCLTALRKHNTLAPVAVVPLSERGAES